ncbi:hypothetical protein 7F23_53 [uncultured Caudovirales phage]|uniref:Uncharacterized protein n=1 Tax=uncultured Caudovirales phage TaxID=2100421 RepID=A0A2H4J9I0_9CAUD|nr:hypothetical protein 7F23_53 [uncultured Caudovirales phage]
MEEFYEVYSKNCHNNGLKLEIYHSPIVDWVVTIYQINPADMENPKEIISIQDPDRKLAIAQAYVALVDWLLENQGGY